MGTNAVRKCGMKVIVNRNLFYFLLTLFLGSCTDIDITEFVMLDTLCAQWEGVPFSLYKLDTCYEYYITDYEVKGRAAQHASKKDGYYIIGISKTKDELIFCENFPELPLAPF